MTALIYKPTFPIPTQGDAGEVLTLNEAGTAYELEPAQGGATVPDGGVWSATADVTAINAGDHPALTLVRATADAFTMFEGTYVQPANPGLFLATIDIVRDGVDQPVYVSFSGVPAFASLELDLDANDDGGPAESTLSGPVIIEEYFSVSVGTVDEDVTVGSLSMTVSLVRLGDAPVMVDAP